MSSLLTDYEELKRHALIAKFEKDMKKRPWWERVLLALDQLGNVIFWNGSQDETISSHIQRRKDKGTATWFDKKLCCLLNKLESSHCKKSLGE